MAENIEKPGTCSSNLVKSLISTFLSQNFPWWIVGIFYPFFCSGQRPFLSWWLWNQVPFLNLRQALKNDRLLTVAHSLFFRASMLLAWGFSPIMPALLTASQPKFLAGLVEVGVFDFMKWEWYKKAKRSPFFQEIVEPIPGFIQLQLAEMGQWSRSGMWGTIFFFGYVVLQLTIILFLKVIIDGYRRPPRYWPQETVYPFDSYFFVERFLTSISASVLTDTETKQRKVNNTLFPGLPAQILVHDGFADQHQMFVSVPFSHMVPTTHFSPPSFKDCERPLCSR